MPTKNSSICTYPGCSTLVAGRPRCTPHAYQRSKDTRRSSSRRGYDTKWRAIRKQYLQAHPLCEEKRKCYGARATEVDHMRTLRNGGTHDWSNLKAMCKPCHSSKTRREDMPC